MQFCFLRSSFRLFFCPSNCINHIWLLKNTLRALTLRSPCMKILLSLRGCSRFGTKKLSFGLNCRIYTSRLFVSYMELSSRLITKPRHSADQMNRHVLTIDLPGERRNHWKHPSFGAKILTSDDVSKLCLKGTCKMRPYHWAHPTARC